MLCESEIPAKLVCVEQMRNTVHNLLISLDVQSECEVV